MAERPELKQYIGKTIDIEAKVTSRSDGGRYGFLLTDMMIPSGQILDHCWLKEYDNDLATVSGNKIRAKARVQRYWKAGRDYDGRYMEAAEMGTGVSTIFNVSAEIDGEWLPLADAARRVRKARAAEIKAKKATGTYVWPGAFTYHEGVVHVKAAKSAVPASLCDAKAKNAMYSRTVRLIEQVVPGVWRFEDVVSSTATVPITS